MSSEKYIPPYRVSGKAMNLIAEMPASVERFDIEISGVKGGAASQDKPHQDDSRLDRRRGKRPHACCATPIENIVWENQSSAACGPAGFAGQSARELASSSSSLKRKLQMPIRSRGRLRRMT